jgi:methylthioribose-1-phosphate isomerase
MVVKAVDWAPSGALRILDQTRLPAEERYLDIDTVPALVEAIRSLRVRGAPAIGIAAAMGLAAAVERSGADVAQASREIEQARPTAVNLAWAMGRMRRAARRNPEPPPSPLRAEAEAIWREDREMCQAIAVHGQELLERHTGAKARGHTVNVLTHCNTGALATGGIGTALGIVHLAHQRGREVHVWVDETRPLLQGSRLTAWELARAGVSHAVLPDTAAATLLKEGRVDVVLVGADRVARNGDTANKLGTYPLAIAARRHGVPLYVVAPSTSFDQRCPDGASIPIEQRPAAEVTSFGEAYNPAFDVTPAELITGWVSERGTINEPSRLFVEL